MSSTRRQFLKQVGHAGLTLTAGAALARGTSALAQGVPATLPALGSHPSTWPIDPALKSVVADIRAREVVAEASLHETLLREMIEDGVRLATRATTLEEAWSRLFKSDDVIAIKFNQVGYEAYGTTDVFAAQLVEVLKRAGIGPDRIMLIEVPTRLAKTLGTRPAVFGWSGGKVSFGSGEDELPAWLQEAGAIINVPFLKTHNLAGMTGCLKNLSHAMIRSPKLCHANGCAPFVGDILALPQIRSKLRLHIVNALRATFDRGPVPRPETSWIHSGILVSTDPVATDHVGLDILNSERARHNLAPVGDRNGHLPYIHAATANKLGTDDQDYIDLQKPPLF